MTRGCEAAEGGTVADLGVGKGKPTMHSRVHARALFALAMSASGLWGCVDVYDVSKTPNDGVPFFTLVPAAKLESRYEQRWSRVDVSVTIEEPTEEVAPPAAGTSPPGQPGRAGATPAAPAATKEVPVRSFTRAWTAFAGDGTTCAKLADLKSGLDRALNKKDAATIVDEITVVMAKGCLEEPEPFQDLKSVVSGRRLGEIRSVEQVPSRELNYIQVEAPFAGSATANVTLDSRGTLQTAGGTVTDTLGGTVATTLSTVATTLLGAALGLKAEGISPLPVPSGVGEPRKIVKTATLSINPQRRTYTVTRRWALPFGANMPFAQDDQNCVKAEASSDTCQVSFALDAPPAEKKEDAKKE